MFKWPFVTRKHYERDTRMLEAELILQEAQVQHLESLVKEMEEERSR